MSLVKYIYDLSKSLRTRRKEKAHSSLHKSMKRKGSNVPNFMEEITEVSAWCESNDYH